MKTRQVNPGRLNGHFCGHFLDTFVSTSVSTFVGRFVAASWRVLEGLETWKLNLCGHPHGCSRGPTRFVKFRFLPGLCIAHFKPFGVVAWWWLNCHPFDSLTVHSGLSQTRSVLELLPPALHDQLWQLIPGTRLPELTGWRPLIGNEQCARSFFAQTF